MRLLLSLLFFIFIGTTAHAQTLYMVGDSTMSNKAGDKAPETGWGQMLPDFRKQQITIINTAINGRSSKSFIDEGRWNAVEKVLQPGDFVVIQFGHNDEKHKDPSRYTEPFTSYSANLTRFIHEARAKGAHPILATSIVRRKFDDKGGLKATHGDYPKAVRQVAKKEKVPLVDLQKATQQLLLSRGESGSITLFVHGKPGELVNYPEGVADNTHLSRDGALEVARLFVLGLAKTDSPLKNYFQSGN